MNGGIYSAASGMAVQRARMGMIVNNIENVSTNGYKRDKETISTFPEVLMLLQNKGKSAERIGLSSFGTALTESITDFEQGPLVETGRSTDFSLGGSGFFVLQAADRLLYTRDGAFSIDSSGYLTNASGLRVLGEHGPIQLTRIDRPLENISVDNEGTITVGERRIDKLLIYDFDDMTLLEKQGDNCYSAPRGYGHIKDDREIMVRQGFLEQSNVDLNTEIVDMMSVLRAYEAGQKILHAQDDLTEQVLRVGSVR